MDRFIVLLISLIPPPLPSSAGHGMGEAVGQWRRQRHGSQSALCLCWLFGCSLLAAHVDGVYDLNYVQCERRRT